LNRHKHQYRDEIIESLTFSERDQTLLIQTMYVRLAEQIHLQPFIKCISS